MALAAQVPNARVVAVDISEDALAVSRENARRLGVINRYSTSIGNALEKPNEHLGKFDIMLCNPPYITTD